MMNGYGIFDDVPKFVGRANDLSTGELGYRRETSADGGTDTIIEFMLAEDYWDDGASDVKMTIHLEDYTGDIRLSDFVFI